MTFGIRHLLTPRLVLRRGEDAVAYLTRWGIRTRFFAIYLHRFEGPDPGVDLHDHPWAFRSLVLRGGYVEERSPISTAVTKARVVSRAMRVHGHSIMKRGKETIHLAGRVNHMPLSMAHRITEVIPGTITLVFCGPKRRTWGFYTPHGWVEHDLYHHPDRSLVAEYREGMGRDEREELA